MDARALVALLAEERTGFVRQARRLLPTEADADDVVQRAMMLASERAASLEDPARLRPWFRQIVRRGVADFYRVRRPDQPSDTDVDLLADTPEPVSNPCQCSVRLVAQLSPSYADVLRRVDLEGGAVDQVAAALAIAPAHLHVRLHRARRALRDKVKQHCGVATCGPCLDCTCGPRGRCGGALG